MIYQLSGDDLGVPRNKNHALYEWREDGKRVVFSATMQGKGLSCHFAAEPDSLRMLKPAINEFCDWALDVFDCRMIIAFINIPSVIRLVTKCGFNHVLTYSEGSIYERSA